MKRVLFIILLSVIFISCLPYKSLNLNRLTTGMTKAQVEAVAGSPQRVLAVKQTSDGYQEVLEYKTSRREIYALEFWNDYLTGYEFMYDDAPYVAPVAPPMLMPDYGKPIIIVRPDNAPNRPNRPGQSSRPPGNTRPPSTRPSTRPSEDVKPTSRPATNSGRTSENNNFEKKEINKP